MLVEHREPGSEYWQLIDTVDREELGDLEKAPPPVCYYVISGNDENRFIVEPLNHRISVRKLIKPCRMYTHKPYINRI